MLGDIALPMPKSPPEPDVERQPGCSTHTVLDNFEGLLRAVAQGAGLQQPISITKAKEELRALGSVGASLASRLGRCSKLQNHCAHPTGDLQAEILHAFAGTKDKPNNAPDGQRTALPAAVHRLRFSRAHQYHRTDMHGHACFHRTRPPSCIGLGPRRLWR